MENRHVTLASPEDSQRLDMAPKLPPNVYLPKVTFGLARLLVLADLCEIVKVPRQGSG